MTKSADAQARNKVILALRREGKSISELARQFGVCRGTIMSALRQNGFVSPRLMPVLERIQARIEYELNTGCWLWPGAHAVGGYGSINDGSRSRLLHIVMWEATHGPKPDHLQVLHKCDTPACCNPDHLFLGTQAENMQDCVRKGRHRAKTKPWDQRGVLNPVAKLNPDKVRAIRASSLNHGAAGRHFGVSRMTIRAVRERKTWSQIE